MKEICLVTGASSGLGRAIVEYLAEKDYTIYITARRKNLLNNLKNQLKSLKGTVKIIDGDLSDPKFRKKLIETILKKEGKIDFLFNNAGFGRATRLENQDPEEMRKMFEVNIVAYSHLTCLALQNMKKRNKGRIIQIGSVVAFTPLPYFTIYNSTKAAVYMLNRSLRYELKGSNVTSTVVLPARMKTGFAQAAYDCYKEKGRNACIQEFNKIAGSPYVVAKNIVKNMDKGKEVITPTLKAKFWYLTRYFGWVVDLVMKYILGPKEEKHLKMVQFKK